MSSLYNQIKSNLDNINTHYRNGITFTKDKLWTAPIDGTISIEGRAKAGRCPDYQLNETMSGWGREDATKTTYPDILATIRQYKPGTNVNVQTSQTNVSKGGQYRISFQSFQQVYFNDIMLNCSVPRSNNNSITKVQSGSGSNYYNAGDVYRIQYLGEPNMCELGDCDVLVTDYKRTEGWQYFDLAVYLQISSVYRQPSQSPYIQEYLKIKYSQDVLSIFGDTF